jgi:hypothetical protein
MDALEFARQAREFAGLIVPSGLGLAWVDGAHPQGYLRGFATFDAGACAHCKLAGERSAALELGAAAETDDAAARTHERRESQAHLLQLHIVLHPVFSQPTLIILGTHRDGSPFGADDVWRHVSRELQAHRGSAFALTEVEHPSLHTPCFAIHPCQTADWMAFLRCADADVACGSRASYLACGSRASYLATWWSAIAPLLHLPSQSQWFCARAASEL